MPATSVITFRVNADLKKRFSARAQKLDRASSQVLRDLMRSFVSDPAAPTEDYDSLFRTQVREAQNDTREPLSSEAVERRFATRREAARSGTHARKRRAG
jgi:hypothetical protein